MKKRLIGLCFLLLVVLITGCNNIKKEEIKIDEKGTKNVKVIIKNKEYILNLESSETAKEIYNLFPLELSMSELNGNEKYAYLDKTVKTSPKNIKEIHKGDVMLYGNNCLVIFYKTFQTTYQYTKIGTIKDLDDLGNQDLIVKFES